jgi:hypothetical protein
MRYLRIRTWALSVLVAVGWLGMAAVAWGQEVADSPTPRTFGTAENTAHVIGATEFETFGPGAWNYAGLLAKWSSVSTLFAAVRLPAGAVVNTVELEGCDTNAAAQVSFEMFRRPSPNGPAAGVTPSGGTGFMQTPGCGFFAVAPLSAISPLVIDNESDTYFVRVHAPSATTTLTAVRVYYSLQVSPAPAVATFGDVPPGHQFFRFIEALKASGITGGCQLSPPLFCPDQGVTRGQMAVFLSKALGLHFAP